MVSDTLRFDEDGSNFQFTFDLFKIAKTTSRKVGKKYEKK